MEHFQISEFLCKTNNEYKIKLIMDKLIFDNNLSQVEKILYYQFGGIYY